jgi:hypothetical protein
VSWGSVGAAGVGLIYCENKKGFEKDERMLPYFRILVKERESEGVEKARALNDRVMESRERDN